jgi:hypothetical protein
MRVTIALELPDNDAPTIAIALEAIAYEIDDMGYRGKKLERGRVEFPCRSAPKDVVEYGWMIVP